MNKNISTQLSKNNDIIIYDDVEPTESYVGVGDNNLVFTPNTYTMIDLTNAQYSDKKLTKKKLNARSKSHIELKIKIPNNNLSAHVHVRRKSENERSTSSTRRVRKEKGVENIATLPDLKARFSAIESEIPAEKARSINDQIEKLASRNSRLVHDKLKQMRELREKGSKNWSQFRSEINFVKNVETKKIESDSTVYINNESHLNEILGELHEITDNQNLVLDVINCTGDKCEQPTILFPNTEDLSICLDLQAIIKPMVRPIPCTPISKDEAIDLKQILFNSPNRCWGSEWYRQNIQFHPSNTNLAFGIIQKMQGPNSLMAVIQAEFLVQALFCGDITVNWLCNIRQNRLHILAKSLARIILRCKDGDSNYCRVCLYDSKLKGQKLGFIKEDGITECLMIYEVDCASEKLIQFLEHHIEQFTGSLSPGLILLVVSCLVTHGLSKCKLSGDRHNGDGTRFISPLGIPKTELLNLLLLGLPVSHVFNDESSPRDAGVPTRGSVGLISVEPHCKICPQIGTYLKTPKYPVWVAKWSGDDFCVLFCLNKTLISDWKTEIRFKLHMYSPTFVKPTIIPIIVDSSRAAIEKRRLNIEEKAQLAERQKKQARATEERVAAMSEGARSFLSEDSCYNGESHKKAHQDSPIANSSFVQDYSDSALCFLEKLIHTKWSNATIFLDSEDDKFGTLVKDPECLETLFKKMNT